MSGDAALVAVTTALLDGRDVRAVLERVLAVEDMPAVELAFRDRSRVRRAAQLAASLLPPQRPLLGQSTGPAGRWVRRTTAPRRAAYVLAAARRLAVAEPDLEAERRHLASHLAAERARADAAGRVDMMASLHGPVLGWRAVQDAVTTPGCRSAHGRNFLAARPPLIEGRPSYPGTQHGGACRCEAVAPYPGAGLL